MINSGKSMNLDDLKVARQNILKFNRMNKLTKKFYSHLRYANIGYYLNFQRPMCHRHF